MPSSYRPPAMCAMPFLKCERASVRASARATRGAAIAPVARMHPRSSAKARRTGARAYQSRVSVRNVLEALEPVATAVGGLRRAARAGRDARELHGQRRVRDAHAARLGPVALPLEGEAVLLD